MSKLRSLLNPSLRSRPAPAIRRAAPSRRLELEVLEARLCPTNVPISGVVHAGDQITVTAILHTNDPNENGEFPFEPVSFTSSGGFPSNSQSGKLFSYEEQRVFTFIASRDGETLDGRIENSDGDETFSATASASSTIVRTQFTAQQQAALFKVADTTLPAVDQTIVVAQKVAKKVPSSPNIVLNLYKDAALAADTAQFLNKLGIDRTDIKNIFGRGPAQFRVVAQPMDATFQRAAVAPDVTQAEADAFNLLFGNRAHAIGLAGAILTAISRASEASTAGDTASQTLQINAAHDFQNRLSLTLSQQPALLSGLQNALTAGGFSPTTVTATDINNLESSIASKGLPADFKTALQQSGVDAATIDTITRQLVVQDTTAAAGNFPASLTSPALVNALNAATALLKVVPPGIGAFDPASSTWYLRATSTAGGADVGGPFPYGLTGWKPVTGHWNGGNTPGIGVYDPLGAKWYLRNTASVGVPDIAPFAYGYFLWTPVTGDWDGNGTTTVGMYDPSTAKWYLRNSNSDGAPSYTVFQFGAPGWIPVVGDWSGSGITGIGAYDPATATFYLRNTASPGAPSFPPIRYGSPGWKPVVGDWDASGVTGIGAIDPNGPNGFGKWYLRSGTPSAGAPTISPFAYGVGNWMPLSGSWRTSASQLAADQGPGAASPTNDELQATVFGALVRLQNVGVDPALMRRLSAAQFALGGLSAGVLGLADPAANRVVLSGDAAGHGWFVDPTPLRDEEFAAGTATGGSAASGREDLLTVVLHEMGHLAGLPDQSGDQGLMSEVLPTGLRRTDALDQIFAGRA